MLPCIRTVRMIAAAALGVLLACSGSSPTDASFTVVYRLTAATGFTFDSVVYEDAHGNLVPVDAPSLPWQVVFTGDPSTYVQATAWGTAPGGGGTATLKVTWTESGVSTAGDSSSAVASAPGGVTLKIRRQQI